LTGVEHYTNICADSFTHYESEIDVAQQRRQSAAQIRREQQLQPRVADQGDGWHIIYHPSTRDYDAHITRNDQGYIGSKKSCDAARELIFSTLIADAA